MALERIKDGRNLFRRQYLDLALFDRRRLPNGRNIAGEGTVLDGASQRGAQKAGVRGPQCVGETFGKQRGVPSLDVLRA